MSGENVSRMEEGLVLLILTRLFLWSMALGLLVYIVNPAWMGWSIVRLPDWLRWTGIALAVSAIPLFYWILRSLGDNVTDTVAVRKEHRLVTYGPYRLVRHPLYSLRIFLLIPAFALVSASWVIGLLGFLWSAMLVARTRIEEAKLIEKNGNNYLEYMSLTGRFLPRVGARNWS